MENEEMKSIGDPAAPVAPAPDSSVNDAPVQPVRAKRSGLSLFLIMIIVMFFAVGVVIFQIIRQGQTPPPQESMDTVPTVQETPIPSAEPTQDLGEFNELNEVQFENPDGFFTNIERDIESL